MDNTIQKNIFLELQAGHCSMLRAYVQYHVHYGIILLSPLDLTLTL